MERLKVSYLALFIGLALGIDYLLAGMTTKSLSIPKEELSKIEPTKIENHPSRQRNADRGPASMGRRQYSSSIDLSPSEKKLKPFISTTCVDQLGRIYRQGDAKLEECMDGATGITPNTSYHLDQTQRQIQMGIIIK